MRLFLTSLLLLSIDVLSAQTGYEKCKTNVELAVSIDTFYQKPDTLKGRSKHSSGIFVDYAASCDPCYTLKTASPNYEVISFVVETESDEYIFQVTVNGDSFARVSKAGREISSAKKGTSIYFYCIKAKHTNGNVYVLKNFSILKL